MPYLAVPKTEQIVILCLQQEPLLFLPSPAQFLALGGEGGEQKAIICHKTYQADGGTQAISSMMLI